jgi:hypothetical protein
MVTPARIPNAEEGIAVVERELAIAARRRVALTSGVVAAALAALVLAACIAATESGPDPIGAPPRDVSRYQLTPLTADGSRVEMRLWVDTDSEYALELEAGARREVLVSDARRTKPAPVDMQRLSFEREHDALVLDDGTALTFETFEEPCPGGSMISWRLCVPNGGCAMAPRADRCWTGALAPVALYRVDNTLWAVVERRMATRVARMAGGVAL